MNRFPHRTVFAVALLIWFTAALPAPAGSSLVSHTVDGAFTSPLEWSGPNVSRTPFAVVGSTGGATLYVDQGVGLQSNKLYLLYDYVNSSATGMTQSNSFFDVFFEVAPEKTDYLIRMQLQGSNQTIETFEKSSGTPSNLTPGGSFDVSTVWKALDQSDLALAQFESAVGTGSSPDLATPHLIAEFALTIDKSSDPGHPSGIYSPDPAFWSASVDNGKDPPISSGIFQLNPDGTTTVTPVLGPNGGPVKEGHVADSPEPASVALLGLGGLGLLGYGWRRRRAAA